MQAVTVENLSKTYSGGKKAVNGISLSLNSGEVFGFLGPNGAGKTTTVKLLNGMLAPSEGSCRILDIDPAEEPEKVHAFSGVVTEHAQMYDNLTGMQNLMFYGAVFGIPNTECKTRAEELLKQLDLKGAENQKLSSYSTGMRQRLSLARALIHQPKILFLDEPTSGLDPESALNVNGLIRSLAKEKGITVFLCTHQLRYAQEICTSYGLIDEGRLFASGTLEELRRQVSSTLLLSITADGLPQSWFRQKNMKTLQNRQYEIEITAEEEIPRLVREMVEAGGNVRQVISRQPSLEDLYFTLTEGGKEKTV